MARKSRRASVDTASSIGADSEDDRTLGDDAADERDMKLREALDQLLEKRAATREGALDYLLKTMRTSCLDEFFEDRTSTAHDALMRCLSRAGSQRIKACQALGLLYLQVDSDDLGESAELVAKLATLADDGSASADDRAACASTLAHVAFVLQDTETIINAWTVLGQILNSAKQEVLLAAAAQGWALLASCVPSRELQSAVARMGSKFLSCVEGGNLALQTAVAQAVVVFNELQQGQLSDSVVEAMLDVFEGLATESNKSKSKKDLKVQHAAFRAFSESLQGSEFSPEKMTLDHEVIVIQSWSKHALVEWLKHVLQQGFQVHCRQNETVRAMLGLDAAPSAPVALSKKEKEALMAQHRSDQTDRERSRAKSRDSKFGARE